MLPLWYCVYILLHHYHNHHHHQHHRKNYYRPENHRSPETRAICFIVCSEQLHLSLSLVSSRSPISWRTRAYPLIFTVLLIHLSRHRCVTFSDTRTQQVKLLIAKKKIKRVIDNDHVTCGPHMFTSWRSLASPRSVTSFWSCWIGSFEPRPNGWQAEGELGFKVPTCGLFLFPLNM